MPTSGEIEREQLRRRTDIVITDRSKCYYCKSTGLTENDKFCPHCAFPQQGTQLQMKIFVIKMKHKKEKLEEQKSKVKKARSVLFILAAVYMATGIIFSFHSANPNALILVSAIVAAIFLGLGIWCNYNPFAAILTGFFVFVTIIVINAVLDPATIVQGIFLKFFAISAFIYGYRAVRESQAMEKELIALNTATDLTETDELPELPA